MPAIGTNVGNKAKIRLSKYKNLTRFRERADFVCRKEEKCGRFAQFLHCITSGSVINCKGMYGKEEL